MTHLRYGVNTDSALFPLFFDYLSIIFGSLPTSAAITRLLLSNRLGLIFLIYLIFFLFAISAHYQARLILKDQTTDALS